MARARAGKPSHPVYPNLRKVDQGEDMEKCLLNDQVGPDGKISGSKVLLCDDRTCRFDNMGFYDDLLSRTRNIEYRNDNSPFWGLLAHGRSANTSKALLSREKLPDHFQSDGLNVVKGLIFPLLRFSALIILFSGNISFSSASSQLSMFSLNCRRSLDHFFNSKIQ